MLTLIAAVSENGVIGNNGQIPWHLPDDMKFFKETTMGSAVITGRKNYESIPEKYRPLPGRLNVVMSSDPDYMIPDSDGSAQRIALVRSVEDALDVAFDFSPVQYVIGGGEIYRLFYPLARKLILTRVHAVVEGNVTLGFDPDDSWLLVDEKRHEADEKHAHAFTFQVYVK